MNEEDIRGLLKKVLVREFANKRIHLIPELGLDHGNCRVDLAVVSPKDLYGFEIKSSEDNLKRLPWQVRYYSQVLDYASIVVAPKHLEEAVTRIPEWWGVFTASPSPFSSKIRIRCRRIPQRNPKIDFYRLIAMMWKGDAVEFLEKRKSEGKVWRRKAKWFLWKRIQETSSEDEVREFIRERLVARTAMESVGGWKTAKKKRKRRRRRGRRRRGRWRKRGRGRYQP